VASKIIEAPKAQYGQLPPKREMPMDGGAAARLVFLANVNSRSRSLYRHLISKSTFMQFLGILTF